MKTLLLFPLTLIAFSCSSTKKENQDISSQTTLKIENHCPDNVDCNFQIFQNKSLNVKTDEIGTAYYEIEENPNKVVFRYQYKLRTDEDLQDGGYLEEVLFEMDQNYGDFSFSGKELQNTKLILNVMCFCRSGKVGAHKINKGTISKKGKNLSIKLDKVIEDQKINEIEISL